MDLHEQAGTLEAIEVAADRGLGGVEEVGELRDGDSVILRNHLDHALATFLSEHVGSFDRLQPWGLSARGPELSHLTMRTIAHFCADLSNSVQTHAKASVSGRF